MASLSELDEDIRYNIFTDLISEPAAPSFEISNPDGKYENYAAVLFTNRQLSIEYRSRIQSSNCHVLISSNYDRFAEALKDHCIPIISSTKLHLVAFHALRIHVRMPIGNKVNKVKSSVLVLESALPEIALLLRCLSLTMPHAPGIPAMTDGTEFERMSLTIKVMKPDGLPIKRQEELLSKLAGANFVGRITLQGVSLRLKRMLPGHTEAVTALPQEPHIVYTFRKCDVYRNHRSRDGMDIAKVSRWMRVSADRAMNIGNFHLAAQRYMGIISYVGICTDQNPYVVSMAIDCEGAIDTEFFHAGLGVSEAHFNAGEFEDAKHHIKPTVEDFQTRRNLPLDRLEYALNLQKRIDAALQTGMKKT